MVVPNIRNPNRYRNLQAAKPIKSQYHLEPDHVVDYKHVGRRTKGGAGGGYIYSSGAYGHNGEPLDAWDMILPILWVVGFLVAVGYYCIKKSDSSRNENHTNIRNTRNNVYRQRSERAVESNDNTTTPPANAIQFHSAPQANNSGITLSTPERHVNMKPYFYFQTVLPDKSNLDPHILREEAVMDQTATDDDDDSVIEKGDDPPGKKQTKKHSLSSRFFMSTWRRPTENDECSICLNAYQPGQSICMAKNPACKHVFHQDCIEEWLKDHSNCPLCRVNIMCRPPSILSAASLGRGSFVHER